MQESRFKIDIWLAICRQEFWITSHHKDDNIEIYQFRKKNVSLRSERGWQLTESQRTGCKKLAEDIRPEKVGKVKAFISQVEKDSASLWIATRRRVAGNDG